VSWHWEHGLGIATQPGYDDARSCLWDAVLNSMDKPDFNPISRTTRSINDGIER
jgi:hypothetical protein